MPQHVLVSILRLPMMVVLLFSILLGGCSLFQKGPVSEDALYEQATRQLDQRNYTAAIDTLEQLEGRFPFGRYAQQLQLDLAYARYMSRNYTQALLDADRFTRLNPDHPTVDYAWFLKGMSYYKLYQENTGITGRGDPAQRSQQQAERAFDALRTFATRFPDSEYRPEAIETMVLLKDALARHELIVADYYMRREAWISAAERAQVVRQHYPGVSAQADALVVLIESYEAMGLERDRDLALETLKAHFPEHDTLSSGDYRSPYIEKDRWWVKVLTLGWFS